MGHQMCWKWTLFSFFIICILNADACKIQLVESIPEGMEFPDGSIKFLSTYDALKQLIKNAKKTINSAMYYCTLQGAYSYNHSTAWQGENIFRDLLDAGANGGIQIRIAQSEPTPEFPNIDTKILAQNHAAEVRSLSMERLLGFGLFHTKLWFVDGQHMYVGSANSDWRSLTQMKELGALITDCPVLVNDVSKIFNVYWDLGKENATIPPSWPDEYSTKINASNPIEMKFANGFKMNAYFTSAPAPFNPAGRSNDLDTVLSIIQNAKQFIHITIMDYIPMYIYSPSPKFWPVIDDALRAAAIDRRVKVKLIVTTRPHGEPSMEYFLYSLKSVSNTYEGVDIQIKCFAVPTTEDQAKIPLTRGNHNKYMVTENTVLLSTSNWSGDYFTHSAGISLVLEDIDTFGTNETVQTIRKDVADIFERDWNSDYVIDMESPVI